MGKEFNGLTNLRFDDTNPVKEDVEYVDSIIEDVKWLGFDWDDRMYYASDYFDKLYDYAVQLIQMGLAYVCEQTSRNASIPWLIDWTRQAKSFQRYPIEENMELFEKTRRMENSPMEAVL